MRKEQILDLMAELLIVIWAITACMIDSDGYIPLIINVCVSGLLGFLYIMRTII